MAALARRPRRRRPAAHGRPFCRRSIAAEQMQLDRARCGAPRATGTACPADRVFALWMRYACDAFYSHPWAWNEIGFGGPAYPRGYKNLGIDRREPWEVPSATPPTRPVGRPGRTSGRPTRPPRGRQSPPSGPSHERSATDEPGPGAATSRPGCCRTTASRTNHRLRERHAPLRPRRRGRPRVVGLRRRRAAC